MVHLISFNKVQGLSHQAEPSISQWSRAPCLVIVDDPWRITPTSFNRCIVKYLSSLFGGWSWSYMNLILWHFDKFLSDKFPLKTG